MKKTLIALISLIALNILPGQSAKAQYTKLYDFGGTANGANPFATLISDGSFLYGTTEKGGAYNSGTIFKIMPDGSGFMKLHDFTGGASDGHTPRGSLYYDGTSLWGMTSGGGAHADGVIFRLLPDGTGYQIVYNFLGITSGRAPEGGFISDGSSLFGMTILGGANNSGTIFKIMLNGTGFTKLFDFESAVNGRSPYGSLVSDGTYLYGMTCSGGSNGLGTLFKIMPDGTGFVKLLDFENTTNGGNPYGSLISNGNILYGMTSTGGANGSGTIFKIMPNGNGYEILLNFDGAAKGRTPKGTLIQEGGFLYGMTMRGGDKDFGTVFKIKHDGSGFLKLLDFTGSANGQEPIGSLFSDGSFLYGMTWKGGADNYGVIFKKTFAAGIYENTQNDISISPNPAFDFITLNNIAGDKNDITMNIFNVTGSLMWSETVRQNQQKINIGNLCNGIYFVEIISSDYTGKQKLIIQR